MSVTSTTITMSQRGVINSAKWLPRYDNNSVDLVSPLGKGVRRTYKHIDGKEYTLQSRESTIDGLLRIVYYVVINTVEYTIIEVVDEGNGIVSHYFLPEC
jgi:hypothetical protein